MEMIGNDLETIRNDLETIGNDKVGKIYRCHCDKVFKTNCGLWKHKKTCIEVVKPTENDLILSLMKQNADLIKQNTDLQLVILKQNETITELAKNSTGTGTKASKTKPAFNLETYLNITCKDAMNFIEFKNFVVVDYNSCNRFLDNGFCQGIISSLKHDLKRIGLNKFPFYCSNLRDKTLWIKNEANVWVIDKNNELITKFLNNYASKFTYTFPIYKENHPDCKESKSKYNDKYNKLIVIVCCSLKEDDNLNKVLNNLLPLITIDKN